MATSEGKRSLLYVCKYTTSITVKARYKGLPLGRNTPFDREVKKENENPSVGVILCASKDDEVVEFALSRSLLSTMVYEYNLKLIDKALLQKKLKEYIELAQSSEDGE